MGYNPQKSLESTINTMGTLTQPMDTEIKSLNFIFPTKHVIPESLKFSHWLSEYTARGPLKGV